MPDPAAVTACRYVWSWTSPAAKTPGMFVLVEPGSVTPFGLINDTQNRITVILEARMMKEPLLNYHPLSNDATTTIAAADLLTFIRSCGHEPRIVALDEA